MILYSPWENLGEVPSLGSRSVQWLGKASACRLQISLTCVVLCHIVSLQYLSRSSLHRLTGLPCRLVLSLWSSSGDARGPSVVFDVVDMPCPGPFNFSLSHSVDYIYEFCPLPVPDVGLSIFVCDVVHTSFHFGLCGRKFALCLFRQCPGLCTICHCKPPQCASLIIDVIC